MQEAECLSTPARLSELNSFPEVSELKYGMDFRKPEYRREVFLRFYEFHLKYRSHPGCVYYLIPEMSQLNGWGLEERLWFSFLNGNTQNPVSSWLIFREFPSANLDLGRFHSWWSRESYRIAYDTDRRYFRAKMPESIEAYQRALGGGRQEDFFAGMGFNEAWDAARNRFAYFGRLSAFSYLEYLRISGLPIDCPELFLDDMSGSRSHRNGLCKVLGRDDLDWHSSNPSFDGSYSKKMISWLEREGEMLLGEAKIRSSGKPWDLDTSYFTMESALCTYKGWHRPNRRYPNCYNDMLFNRIRDAESKWAEEMTVFWDIRKKTLPDHLRLEDCPGDPGLKSSKQNHYLLTGEPVMMYRDWPCFRNRFNDRIVHTR